jgi:hypothetical protein
MLVVEPFLLPIQLFLDSNLVVFSFRVDDNAFLRFLVFQFPDFHEKLLSLDDVGM